MASTSKRKNVPKHQANYPDGITKSKKPKNKDHLRSSTVGANDHSQRNSNGTFKMQWSAGDDVHFKLDDKNWVEAKIKSVEMNSCDVNPLNGEKSKLRLEYPLPDGSGDGIIDIYNSDYNVKLRKIDGIAKHLDGKPEQVMYQALSKLITLDERNSLQDEFKKSGKFTFEMMFKTVIAADGESFNALNEISETILKDADAHSTIEEVLNSKNTTIEKSTNVMLLSCGYFVGNMVGVELQNQSKC